MRRVRVHLRGIVQGVGFRPFVHNLAARLQLAGWVLNSSAGLIAEVEGERVDAFLDAIKDALKEQKNIEVRGFGTFKIRQRKTRMARNPRTGSPVEVSARPVPVFKPSKELRALVAEVDATTHPGEASPAA